MGSIFAPFRDIWQFIFALGDRIWLSTGDAANFQALASKISMVGADTVISLSGQTIVLMGVSSSSLTAQDFAFA